MANLYDVLHNLCTKKGITGAKMCVQLGISKSLMTDLKSGRKKGINAETAQKIASYFGVTVGYLLGEEEKEKKPIQEDELSENRQKIIDFAMSVPEDKIDLVLKLMRTIVEDL